MRFNHLFRVLISIALLIFSPLSRAEPMLNGIGVHQELGREIFIGALFSESLSNDPGTLLRNQQPMRMELKIVSPEGITARRFSRLWIEGLAVNSKAEALMAQADNTVAFDAMFKGRLVPNDYVKISHTPGKGVSVTLNDVLLGTIKDENFFSMLLATWIGSVPLSSDYRDSLLKVGDVNTTLRARFSTIAPSSARVAEVRDWAQGGELIAQNVKSSTPVKSTAAKSSARAKEELVVERPEIKLPTVEIEKPTLDVPAPAAQVAASAAASSVAAKPVAVTQPAPAKVEEEEDEGPALTAQTLLARQFYVSDAIKKIRSKTKYPQRALDRGQAGNVRVAVVIDRNGNILNTNILENSAYEMLNKEALDAVKRSAPFPALPDAISGARFEFTVPMRWTLPE
jgi:periplasmic protein TonB